MKTGKKSFFQNMRAINAWKEAGVVCSDAGKAWERERVKQKKRAKATRMRVGNLSVRSLRPRAPANTLLRNHAVSQNTSLTL
jgi:hypothetical protein